MSETTLRLIHQALNKIVTNRDTLGALEVTTFPALPAQKRSES
jgi:hypothetical protein